MKVDPKTRASFIALLEFANRHMKVFLEVPGESETQLLLVESIERARAVGDRWVAEHDTKPGELASWTQHGAYTPRILNEKGDLLAARMPSGRWALSVAGQYAARVEECEATIARLAPLIRYARHYGACESTKEPWPGVIDGPLPCTCGLNAVIGAIGSAHVDKIRKEATACAGSAGDTPGKPADDQTPEDNDRGERREDGQHAAVVPPPGSAAATSGDNAPAVFKTAARAPVPSPPHGSETGRRSFSRWREPAKPGEIEWTAPLASHRVRIVGAGFSTPESVHLGTLDTAPMVGGRVEAALQALWPQNRAPAHGEAQVWIAGEQRLSVAICKEVDTPSTVAAMLVAALRALPEARRVG